MNTFKRKPSVSIAISAYNEAEIIKENVNILCDYLDSLKDYTWELVLVNDGSKDETGKIADELASGKENIRILHNEKNIYLGNSLRKAFEACRGDYIVTLDIDLSYSVDHIKKLLDTIVETKADVVIASPYMKGGKVTGVPFIRNLFSKLVNKFLSLLAHEKIYTFTGMVRAYNRKFLKNLSLKAQDFEINPEIIYKTLLLRGRVVEIPGHLDWTGQKEISSGRKSKIHFTRGILSGLMSGFIFRPYFFFMIIGIVLFMVAFYIIVWLIVNTIVIYPHVMVSSDTFFDDRFSVAVAEIFRRKPYAFLVGGVSLIVSLQFLSLGFLSLQSKRYFEELFNLNTNILKQKDNGD